MRGFVYCFKHEDMPQLCKIGETERDISMRLKEANASHTWLPTDGFCIAFAIITETPTVIEREIHSRLSSFRRDPQQEWFRRTPEECRSLFDEIVCRGDAEWWVPEEVVPLQPLTSHVSECVGTLRTVLEEAFEFTQKSEDAVTFTQIKEFLLTKNIVDTDTKLGRKLTELGVQSINRRVGGRTCAVRTGIKCKI